jgi:hypothetical protein
MTDFVAPDSPRTAFGDVTLSSPVEADYAAFRAAADDEGIWRWFTYRTDWSHFGT